jgi:hypothetical protein
MVLRKKYERKKIGRKEKCIDPTLLILFNLIKVLREVVLLQEFKMKLKRLKT